MQIFISLFCLGLFSWAVEASNSNGIVMTKIESAKPVIVRDILGKKQERSTNQGVLAGETISTGKNRFFDLILADGAILRLGPGSEIQFVSLIDDDEYYTWRYRLKRGWLRSVLGKPAEGYQAKLIIDCGQKSIDVLNGEAFIRCYPEDEIKEVVAIKNRLVIKGLKSSQLILDVGKKVKFLPKSSGPQVSDFDMDKYLLEYAPFKIHSLEGKGNLIMAQKEENLREENLKLLEETKKRLKKLSEMIKK